MVWHYQPEMEHDEGDSGFLSVAHYMLYWRISAEERAMIAQVRNTAYAASNLLKRVKPGDVLWIVTVSQHQLFLLGRLKVEFVVDDTAIAQELVDPQPEQWEDADWYAISNKYAIEPMRSINITSFADHLRFLSRASEMLDIRDGRIDASQLTTLRRLSAESAQLLDDVWYNDAFTPQSVQDYLELTEDDQAYAEGKMLVRTVKHRQRNRKLVTDAKLRFRSLHDGHLFCEVCGFDFSQMYGVDYIEVHHTRPVSSLEEESENTLDAVTLLCANCHRAAHTRTPPYSVEELKQMINSRRDGIIR
jgi:predicted HNH restriction endonuclease